MRGTVGHASSPDSWNTQVTQQSGTSTAREGHAAERDPFFVMQITTDDSWVQYGAQRYSNQGVVSGNSGSVGGNGRPFGSYGGLSFEHQKDESIWDLVKRKVCFLDRFASN